jgi:hypothetical protein
MHRVQKCIRFCLCTGVSHAQRFQPNHSRVLLQKVASKKLDVKCEHTRETRPKSHTMFGIQLQLP